MPPALFDHQIRSFDQECLDSDLVCKHSRRTSFAFVSMVAGVFGMNLQNRMENSHVSFLFLCYENASNLCLNCTMSVEILRYRFAHEPFPCFEF